VKVLATRRLPGPAWEELGDVEVGAVDGARPDVEVLIVAHETVDEAVLARLPALRLVANYGVGYDRVDVAACARRGVAVTNTPGVLTNATAELALALTLAAARRVGEAEAELRAGRWRGWDPGDLLGLELSGATFGVVGMGRIGRRYAELVAAFDGRILYASPRPRPDAEDEVGASRVTLGDLLNEADVVSLHARAVPETAGLIGGRELDAMKDHAVLVNTARGSLVDSDALARALRDGAIGAAGLDVYEHEPEVPRALLDAPRCVVLPHIGSATTRARNAMASLVADNVLAALSGAEPPNRIA
jgi:glyoxylate reductase